MAAVLCSSIGSCCSALGHCLTFPCQACGTCCSSCCSSMGRVLTSPFTPYLLTTVLLNFPPAVWGLRTGIEIIKYKVSCQNSRWLYINALLSIVHLLAAFYIVHRIQEDRKEAAAMAVEGSSADHPIDPEATNGDSKTNYKPMDRDGEVSKDGNNNTNPPAWQSLASAMFPGPARAAHVAHTAVTGQGEGEANSFQRLKQVFCYDIGVAVYILAIIFWFIWQSVGISQVLFGKDGSDSYVCENIEKRTILSILCGFLYIMLVSVTFLCSFICLK